MRIVYLALFLLLAAPAALAAESPPGQIAIDKDHILRGQFAQDSLVKGFANPMVSTGRFVVAPGHGLIWMIEKPMATSTIITPNGAVQDIGGMQLKLHIKNLRHLYDMIGGALAGDWSALATDYEITPSRNGDHWQMLLMPRPGKSGLTYASIAVTGSRFVENIAMLRDDGGSDRIGFSAENLAPAPLAPDEASAFAMTARQ